ncbi:hypothetical protein G9A89_021410 [Geosiphon pyriformis]|nr:hypothetical protein G9A89_021410 [Geosiphon pyriformis]
MRGALIVEYLIEDSLPGGILAIKLRKKLTKLRFREATEETITIESLFVFNSTPEINQHQQTQTKSGRIRKHRSKPFRIREIPILTLLSTLGIKYLITYTSKGKEKLQIPAVTPKKIQPPTWKKTRVESPTTPSYYYTLGSAINITSANLLGPYGKYFEKFKSRSPIPSGIRSLLPQLNFGTTTPWKLSEEEEEKSEDQEFTYQNPITENPEVETLNLQAQQNLNLKNSEIKTLNHQRQNNPNFELINQQNLSPINNVTKAITANNWDDTRTMQVIPYFLKNTADSWYHSLAQKSQNFNAFKLEFLRYFSNNNSINHLASTFTTIKQGDTEAVTTYLECFHRNLCQIQAIQDDYFTAPQILNQFIRGLHSNLFQRVCPMHPVDLPTTVIHARDFEAAELKANHIQAVNLVMNGSSELDSKLKQFSNSINQKLEEYLANNCAIYQPPQQCNNPGNTNHFQNQSCSSLSSAVPNQLWQPKTHVCHNCDKQEHIRADCKFYSNNPRSGNQYQNPDYRFQTQNHYLNQDQYQTTYLPMMQQPIYQPPVYQPPIYQLQPPKIYQPQLPVIYQLWPQVIYQLQSIQTLPQNSVNMTSGHSRLRITQNWRSAMVVHQLIPSSSNSPSGSCSWNSGTSATQNPNFQNYLSLLITPEDTTFNTSETNQQATLPSNIPPATVTNNESLAAIFPFKLEEPFQLPLFSGAALKEKPITAMYTNVKVDRHFIKLIFNSSSAGSIITKQLMNQLDHRVDWAASTRIITADGTTKMPIGEIDDFLIEVNGIIIPIKVLVMEAT